MNASYPNVPGSKSDAEDKIVYVRAIAVSDLPEEVQAQADGMAEIFSVNSADGERLALVASRRMAFALARENDFAPVNVH